MGSTRYPIMIARSLVVCKASCGAIIRVSLGPNTDLTVEVGLAPRYWIFVFINNLLIIKSTITEKP